MLSEKDYNLFKSTTRYFIHLNFLEIIEQGIIIVKKDGNKFRMIMKYLKIYNEYYLIISLIRYLYINRCIYENISSISFINLIDDVWNIKKNFSLCKSFFFECKK
jgi:hypothetical protein